MPARSGCRARPSISVSSPRRRRIARRSCRRAQSEVIVDATDGHVIVRVDRLVLREAVTNVLDNAIKYGPDGSTVAMRVERVGDAGLLAVADRGRASPPEHRERIFNRFFRVDEARSRERGGAGLGLAIAKWAVEIHGGRITVHERAGRRLRVPAFTCRWRNPHATLQQRGPSARDATAAQGTGRAADLCRWISPVSDGEPRRRHARHPSGGSWASRPRRSAS